MKNGQEDVFAGTTMKKMSMESVNTSVQTDTELISELRHTARRSVLITNTMTETVTNVNLVHLTVFMNKLLVNAHVMEAMK